MEGWQNKEEKFVLNGPFLVYGCILNLSIVTFNSSTVKN